MNIKVVGPRILVKVKNYARKEAMTYEGSSILMAETVTEQETLTQTIGEVVQLGDTAYTRKDAGSNGTPWVKPGDLVHFSRYGAMRIKSSKKTDDDYELWVLMDKDILAIEEV